MKSKSGDAVAHINPVKTTAHAEPQPEPRDQLRVLAISINYAPEQTGFAQHMAALAAALAGNGHRITVLTGFPFSPQWRRWSEYRRRVLSREEIDGVEVIRASHFIPRRPGGLAQRVWMEVSFSLMAIVALARTRQRRWNVVFYCGAQPTLAMLARVLAWWCRIPYIVNIQDLAAEAAAEVGMVRNQILASTMGRFEYAAYRGASRALVLCEAFRDRLVEQGYAAEHIHVICSPIDIDHIRPVAPSGRFRAANGIAASDFMVLYAGSMGLKQGLGNVIKAAMDVRTRSIDIKWVLVGDGEFAPLLRERIARGSLSNEVKLLPLQPEVDMPEMFASADVLLLNQKGSVKDTVVPSKLLTYMAAGKPVLAAVSDKSQGASLLKQAGGGFAVTPDDPRALAEAVLELRDRDRSELSKMGRFNRQFAERHFDRRRIVAMQEAVLREVAFQRAPAADARLT